MGNQTFDCPEHVKKGVEEALAKGYSKYTPIPGILPLRESIAEKLKRDQELEFRTDEIIVTNGGKQALTAAFYATLNPGDEVIIPAPYWTSYPDMVRLAGGEPVIVSTKAELGYRVQAEDILKASSKRTKAIVLNFPSNPTGACLSKEELLSLKEALISLENFPEILIITDDVYEYFVYDNKPFRSFASLAPELKDNVLIVNAFSKSYSMTGWRVGYAAGPKQIIKAMGIHQSQFTSNVCSIAQWGALRAYDDNAAFPLMMREKFQQRRAMVIDAISEAEGLELPVPPDGAFYVFPRIEQLLGKRTEAGEISSANDFVKYLMEEHDTVVVQGEAFGDPLGFRLSFALGEEQLKQGPGKNMQCVQAN